MNKILIVLVIVSLAGSIAYERWAVKDALRKLHEIKISGDEEAFLRAIDNPYIRMHISKFARAFMKLNYWVDQDREEQVKNMIPVITSMKCSSKEIMALYLKLLGYARKKGWYIQARKYAAALLDELKDKTDRQSVELRQEIRYIEQNYLTQTSPDCNKTNNI